MGVPHRWGSTRPSSPGSSSVASLRVSLRRSTALGATLALAGLVAALPISGAHAQTSGGRGGGTNGGAGGAFDNDGTAAGGFYDGGGGGGATSSGTAQAGGTGGGGGGAAGGAGGTNAFDSGTIGAFNPAAPYSGTAGVSGFSSFSSTGGSGGGGGAGGYGAILTGAGAFGTTAALTGGAGGNGGDGYGNTFGPGYGTSSGGNAGGGGSGLFLRDPGINFTAGTSAIITGGAGGEGGYGVDTGPGGVGGQGGSGLLTDAAATFTNNGQIVGGVGGVGGDTGGVTSTGPAGAGGEGGAGMLALGGGTFTNAGSIAGGSGGVGGTSLGSGLDGNGGIGGIGVQLDAGGTFTNAGSGVIIGGTGGDGGGTGVGGDGGAGFFAPNGGTLINNGTITGGTTSANGGARGAGIVGADLAVVNGGTISVGAQGGFIITAVPPGATGSAIIFTGGVNSLTLLAGSTITGNVLAFSALDTLALGGTQNSSFAVSAIDDGTNTAQYRGFGIFQKTGPSTWTLTGTTGAVTPWQVLGGTLAISSDANLGAPSGGVTLNGGTLRTTASLMSGRTITLGANNGALFADSGTTLTLTGPATGPGGLTLSGPGTVVMAGNSSYTGGTLVSFGTLQVEGSIASSPLTTIASGAALTGTGTVGGILAQSGGLVAPGNAGSPFGTLSATGPVNLAGGSTFAVNTSPTAASRLTTTGTATIANANLRVAPGTIPYSVPVRLPILTAASGLSGQFGPVTFTSPVVGLQPSVVYDANNAFLQFGDGSAGIANPAQDFANSVAAAQRLARDRFGAFVNLRILASVLQGFHQQINCGDCFSGFASGGSFSAGLQGRKQITDSFSITGGIAYAEYESRGVRVRSAPILAGLLRYDFVELGSARPFIDVGAIVAPGQDMRNVRRYGFGNGAGAGRGDSGSDTTSSSVFGRLGYVARVTPVDEVAGSVEISRGWQRVGNFSEGGLPSNPFPLASRGGTDSLNIVKAGAQWTHLFAEARIETQLNLGVAHGFDTRSGLRGSVAGIPIAAPIGDYTWAEYGARAGYRIQDNWIIDAFVDGTLGARPIGNTIHGGLASRYTF